MSDRVTTSLIHVLHLQVERKVQATFCRPCPNLSSYLIPLSSTQFSSIIFLSAPNVHLTTTLVHLLMNGRRNPLDSVILKLPVPKMRRDAERNRNHSGAR
jgi:hypothetical protein